MTLRAKTGFVIATVLAGLVAGVSAVLRLEISTTFARLDREEVERDVARVRAALDRQIAHLSRDCSSAAEFDDAYAFVAGSNPNFVKTDIGAGKASDLAQRGLNLELYLDTSARTVFGEGFDLSTSRELPVPAGAAERLGAILVSGHHPEGLKGLVVLPGGVMMVAAHSIRTTQGAGPPRGWLVMGRWLDEAGLASLGDRRFLQVGGEPLSGGHLSPGYQAARQQLQGPSTTAVQTLRGRSIAGYTLLPDLEGKPSFLLRVQVPSTTSPEERRSLRYYLAALVVLAVLFGVLTVFLLEKNVLGRLTRLSECVLRIGLKGDPSERVPVEGDDELAGLGESINRTLGSLEDAQRKRREIEERFGVLFRSFHIGLVIFDSAGRAILANSAAHQMLGLTGQELTGWHYGDERWLLVGEDGSPLKEEDRPPCRALRSRQPVRDVLIGAYRAASDDWVWMLASAEPQLAEDGSVRTVVCTMSDITARRRAEEALRENELRTRLIIDTAMDAVISADEAGRITGWNRRAEEILGWSREEALGQPWLDLIVPARFREQCRERYSHFLVTGEHSAAGRRSEILALRRDGSEFPAELSIAPARAGGRWILSGFLRDVTERKRAEAELLKAKEAAEAASKAKSEFLANMSHEIRTPMNGIMGMTELALDGPLSDEQREYLAAVRSSADSLLTVINDILDFSKIEAGKLTLHPCAFDLRQCLDEAVKPLTFRAREKGLEWRCEVADDVPQTVVGDPTRLKQIIINLVANAVKFTERGLIRLRVDRDSARGKSMRVRFSVTDTGIGIPLDKQKLIFEAFSQADTSTSRKYGGTGLGLTISSRLVEMMGGEVGLESEPGKGSTIHFTARFGLMGRTRCGPGTEVGKSDGRRPAAGGQSAAGPDRLPLRILLAEDNRVNREIVRRWIEDWGHSVDVVNNGREALDRVAAEAFDVLLMDVQMPVMDGLDATAAIRSRERETGGHLPIIALTAYAMAGDRERCLESGMDEYLAKPVSREKLRAAIVACLGLQASRAIARGEVQPVDQGAEAQSQTPPDGTPAVFDADAALEQVDGDCGLLRKLGDIFLENRKEMLIDLHRALELGDADGVARFAQLLNGTLGNLGAGEACREAFTLEELARQGRLAEATDSAIRLEAAIERLQIHLSGTGKSPVPEFSRA